MTAPTVLECFAGAGGAALGLHAAGFRSLGRCEWERVTRHPMRMQNQHKPWSDEQYASAFWSKVDRSSGPEACWPFTGARQRSGYGHLRVNKKDKLAHRIAWAYANRTEIPVGAQVNHACDCPPCCNPAHLHLGTNRTNTLESVARGRNASVTHPERIARGDRNGARTRPDRLVRGERHWCAKLRDDQRREIVALVAAGETRVSLAARFGVTRFTIWRVVRDYSDST